MNAKVVGIVVASLLSLLVGCANPSADGEDDGTSGAAALEAGEVEARVLLDRVDSTAPELTGVDYWRLSLVTKEGSSEVFAAALGFRGNEEVLDVVLGLDAGDQTHIRLQGQKATEFTPAFSRAIAADMEQIKQQLQQPGTATTTATLSLRPLGGPPQACDTAKTIAMLSKASIYFFGATALVSCGPITMFVTMGGSIPVCVVSAGVTVGAVLTNLSVQGRHAECSAE